MRSDNAQYIWLEQSLLHQEPHAQLARDGQGLAEELLYMLEFAGMGGRAVGGIRLDRVPRWLNLPDLFVTASRVEVGGRP